MSATVYPLQPTPAYQQNETPLCDDSDDDISLANIMSRKLQVNQQVMINNWTTSNYQYCYGDTIPVIGYQPYYNNNQQLTNPHLIPYNTIYQQQQLGHSRNSGRPRTPNLGTNHRSSLQKSRSTPLNTHQASKIRVSPSSTKKSKPSSNRQYSSSSASSSLSSTSSSNNNNNNNKKYIIRDELNDCESQSSSTPSFTPSLIDDNSTRRSSIYSLTSATTSCSVKTPSDTASIYNDTNSSSLQSSPTTKKVTVKRSFSKKLKHVFTGSNNNNHLLHHNNKHQDHHHQQQQQPTLKKSPSISSLSSVISVNTTTSENNSIRHSFVSLFRRPSKLSTHNEQDDHPSIESDQSSKLPKQSISLNNHKQQHDAPSVISLSSETTTISNSSVNNNKQPLSKDGLDVSLHNITTTITSPYTSSSYLQHSSPILKPSTNYKSDGSVVSNDFNDDAVSSIYAGSINSYTKPSSSSSTHHKHHKKHQQLRKQSIQSLHSHHHHPISKVRFTRTVQVHDTFSSREYDRQCDEQTTCQTLTPMIALQIKQELNEYKLNEMEVHPHSRQYTHFFL